MPGIRLQLHAASLFQNLHGIRMNIDVPIELRDTLDANVKELWFSADRITPQIVDQLEHWVPLQTVQDRSAAEGTGNSDSTRTAGTRDSHSAAQRAAAAAAGPAEVPPRPTSNAPRPNEEEARASHSLAVPSRIAIPPRTNRPILPRPSHREPVAADPNIGRNGVDRARPSNGPCAGKRAASAGNNERRKRQRTSRSQTKLEAVEAMIVRAIVEGGKRFKDPRVRTNWELELGENKPQNGTLNFDELCQHHSEFMNTSWRTLERESLVACFLSAVKSKRAGRPPNDDRQELPLVAAESRRTRQRHALWGFLLASIINKLAEKYNDDVQAYAICVAIVAAPGKLQFCSDAIQQCSRPDVEPLASNIANSLSDNVERSWWEIDFKYMWDPAAAVSAKDLTYDEARKRLGLVAPFSSPTTEIATPESQPSGLGLQSHSSDDSNADDVMMDETMVEDMSEDDHCEPFNRATQSHASDDSNTGDVANGTSAQYPCADDHSEMTHAHSSTISPGAAGLAQTSPTQPSSIEQILSSDLDNMPEPEIDNILSESSKAFIVHVPEMVDNDCLAEDDYHNCISVFFDSGSATAAGDVG